MAHTLNASINYITRATGLDRAFVAAERDRDAHRNISGVAGFAIFSLATVYHWASQGLGHIHVYATIARLDRFVRHGLPSLLTQVFDAIHGVPSLQGSYFPNQHNDLVGVTVTTDWQGVSANHPTHYCIMATTPEKMLFGQDLSSAAFVDTVLGSMGNLHSHQDKIRELRPDHSVTISRSSCPTLPASISNIQAVYLNSASKATDTPKAYKDAFAPHTMPVFVALPLLGTGAGGITIDESVEHLARALRESHFQGEISIICKPDQRAAVTKALYAHTQRPQPATESRGEDTGRPRSGSEARSFRLD